MVTLFNPINNRFVSFEIDRTKRSLSKMRSKLYANWHLQTKNMQYFISLTYSDEHEPGAMRKFINSINQFRKKRGLAKISYFGRVELGSLRFRLHHHLMTNCIPVPLEKGSREQIIAQINKIAHRSATKGGREAAYIKNNFPKIITKLMTTQSNTKFTEIAINAAIEAYWCRGMIRCKQITCKDQIVSYVSKYITKSAENMPELPPNKRLFNSSRDFLKTQDCWWYHQQQIYWRPQGKPLAGPDKTWIIRQKIPYQYAPYPGAIEEETISESEIDGFHTQKFHSDHHLDIEMQKSSFKIKRKWHDLPKLMQSVPELQKILKRPQPKPTITQYQASKFASIVEASQRFCESLKLKKTFIIKRPTIPIPIPLPIETVTVTPYESVTIQNLDGSHTVWIHPQAPQQTAPENAI